MPTPRTIDLLLKGGTILCMDKDLRILEGHHVAIDQGRILDIFPTGSQDWSPRETLDATGCLILPGLINSHTHLPMSYFRGLADDLPLQTWLNDYIWPLEAKLLDRKFIADAALHGAAEMIAGGITQIHDMYFDMPAIAESCSRAGLRAMIGGAVIENQPEIHSSGANWLEQLLEAKRRFADDPLLDFDLAPHSIYVCPQATLEKCAQAASDHALRLHMHLSETRDEVQNCIKDHGRKPVFYLKELGILDLPAVYAHGIWVGEDEMELLADAPASIAVCTECNLKLASGILPLEAYLRRGVNVCLATDGVASNNNLDLFSEMDVTAKLQKAVNHDPSFLPAVKALQMATCDAARALGVEDRRGSLEPGKDADICVLELESLAAQPLYNPYSHVVYALGSRSVRDVVINGRIVLKNRRLTQLDEAELIDTAKRYQTRIQKELGR